jgi:hypothetical protein
MFRKQTERASNTVAEKLKIEREKYTKTKFLNVFSNVSFHFAPLRPDAPFSSSATQRQRINNVNTCHPCSYSNR